MRPRTVPALLALAASAALAPSLASAAAPADLEQFNRATGTAGAFGLYDGYPLATRVAGITDNGRYVFWSHRKPTFPDADVWIKDLEPGEGLWMRDVLLNRTTLVSADGGGAFTGIDRTQHLVSFISSEALSSADTNGRPDLYAFEPTTGVKVLISRANGHGGKAVGLTGLGTVTRGSTTAIFTAQDGIYRRDLLRGKTTKIGTGNFIASLADDELFPVIQATADQYVSNDAKVFLTDQGVVSPQGTTPLPDNPYGGSPFKPFVTEAGNRLIWQAGFQGIDEIRVKDLATGAVTTPPAPVGLDNFGVLHRPTADGSGVILGTVTFDDAGGYVQATKRWTFSTGELVDLSDLVFPSRNEKYGITGDRSGAFLAGPTRPGVRLPGTIDLPSAIAYIGYNDGCQYDENWEPIRLLQVSPERNVKLPLATTARFVASAGPGEPVVVDETVAVPTDDNYHEELMVELPFADGAFRLDVTITLADGRTITSRVDHGPRAVPEGC